MAKVLVSLPAGYDNKLIMESKDFATLQDLFEKSARITERYVKGEYRFVQADDAAFYLNARSLFANIEVMTSDEFNEIGKDAS